MRHHRLPSTVSAAAVAAAEAADNRVHRWPMTPRITARLREKGAAQRLAGFETDRVALGVEVTERADRHLLMEARSVRAAERACARGGEPGPGSVDMAGLSDIDPAISGSPVGNPDIAGYPGHLSPEKGDHRSPQESGAWVLWIHGGGFCWGSARDGTGLRLAAGLSLPVVSVEYSLAPQARFPVALKECVAAYRAGVEDFGPRVILGGVSAGANLALGVLQEIQALRRSQTPSAAGEGVPLPLGVVALTPFGDLAGEGDSYTANEGRDAYIRWQGQQEKFARAYAGGADLRDPRLSPVHADWSGEQLPPAFFTTGTRDLFLSDAARIHAAWRTVGGEAELVVAEGMWHSYHSDPGLPESVALMERLLAWCTVLSDQ